MASTYELISKYQYALEDLTSDDPEAVDAAVDALTVAEAEFDKKLPQLARVLKNLEGDIDATHNEKMRLDKRERVLKNAYDRVKELIRSAMIVTGKEKVKTDIGSFKVVKNPAKCVIQDLYCIPDEFLIAKEPDVDKKRILEYYKQTGEIIPGCDIVREDSLRFF